MYIFLCSFLIWANFDERPFTSAISCLSSASTYTRKYVLSTCLQRRDGKNKLIHGLNEHNYLALQLILIATGHNDYGHHKSRYTANFFLLKEVVFYHILNS